MGRICTICTHPDRSGIESALEAGQPLREVAAGYGTSKTALHRHRHFHLAEQAPRPMEEARRHSGTRMPALVKWGLVVIGIWAVAWLRGAVGDSRIPGQV